MVFNLLQSGMNFSEIVIYLLLFIPIFLIAFSVHEASHAFAAWKLGDPTARNLGRMTLDPRKHIDPIGAIGMLLIGIGWGKAVPINSRNFKKPKRDMALSSLAGPLSNFLLAFLGVILYNLINRFTPNTEIGFGVWPFMEAGRSDVSIGVVIGLVLMTFFYYFSWMNVSLAVFNLIPIPPFDGSRIAFVLLPDRIYWKVMQYERYIFIGLIALLFLLNRILPVSPISLIANFILEGLYNITKWIALL